MYSKSTKSISQRLQFVLDWIVPAAMALSFYRLVSTKNLRAGFRKRIFRDAPYISCYTVLLTLVFLLSLVSPHLICAQEWPSFDNPFEDNLPQVETAAHIASWNPGTGVGHIAVHYQFPEGYHQIDSSDYFSIKPEKTAGIIFGSVLKGEPIDIDGTANYFDQTTVLLEFIASPDVDTRTLAIHAHFQICDEFGTCLFPDSDYHTIRFDPSASSIESDETGREILRWNNTLSRETGGREDDFGTLGTATMSSLLLFLLMAFIGGALLNIMPCVLPLLSVKALGLVRQAHSDRRAILGHAWLYVAGIEVSFWILAAIVIALQSSGKLLGWGFQFQSPVFVLILIAVIWVFALSLFDVFVIEAPRKGLEGISAASTRGGYLGSFMTGIFAVLVATPCTAPFLGTALGFAFSQSPLVIFMIFSATGIGLGFPFLLLGVWPNLIEKLPKPGAWMNTFKEVMGFLLLGTTLYLLTTFMQLAPGAVNGVLWWLLALGFSAWLLGKARYPSAKKWFRIAGQISAVIIVLITGLMFIDLTEETSTARNNLPSMATARNRALNFDEADILQRIDAGETVFLEFTAQWCTTCKLNQRVFNNNSVQDMMTAKNIVHIIGDLTSYDETLTRWLARFNRAGVPLYILYSEGEEPYIFPELITARLLVRTFERIGE